MCCPSSQRHPSPSRQPSLVIYRHRITRGLDENLHHYSRTESPCMPVPSSAGQLLGSRCVIGDRTAVDAGSAEFLDESCLWFHADDIYRDDVVFKDPRNTVRGKKNYQRIFQGVRALGRVAFLRCRYCRNSKISPCTRLPRLFICKRPSG